METEQQRLEILLASNAFLHHIFYNIQDGIILTDPDGLITFVNPSTEKIIGIAGKDLLGTRAADLPVAMYTEEHDKLAKRDKPFALAGRTTEDQGAQRVLLQRPDGKTTPLLFNVGTAEDRQMVAILTDISELVSQQQQMEDYFNFTAHDLRTPLTVILSYLELMDQHELSTVDSATALRQIHKAALQMLKMVQGITEGLRFEASGHSFDKTHIDIAELVRDIATLHTMDENHQPLQIDVPEGLSVSADSNLMHRALYNLITNSAKYSPAESTITIQGWETAQGIQLTVRDEGVGIDPSDQPYLFDPFYITSVGKKKGGVGLGLHITDKIIRAHGGNLFVCSEPGQGTTFAIFLPH